MATLPRASNQRALAASASVGGADLIMLIAPCVNSPDAVPRLFGSASDIYAQHGYCEAVEYASYHEKETDQSMLVLGIPIVTAGTVGRHDTSGNTGTSVSTVTAGGDGVLCEHDGVLTVSTGGTIGTSQIILDLSLDGGMSSKSVRLGTATSYTIPYFGLSVSFAAGTLVAGNVIHTWHGTGPRGDSTGWTSVFDALAAQPLQFRTGLLFGDIQTDTELDALYTLIKAYDTSDDRYTCVRVGVFDRSPLAAMSNPKHNMSACSVTFAEVGGTGDTITRSTGSWLTDSFADNDMLVVSGSASNNEVHGAKIVVTSATVITLDTDDLEPEGPVANVTITGEPSLTFADATDTIVRAGGSPGSWLDDGFRAGGNVTITDTVSNNGTFEATVVTASTITFEEGNLADEVIGITTPTIVAGQTTAAWQADIATEFASVDDKEYIALSCGKARKYSRFSGWHLRFPAAWAASLREYQHDLHIPPWRKADGPTGWSLYDAEDTLVEYDDRVHGAAASAARFTSFRTWANGPAGSFISLSLTRALDASLLVYTHNLVVVNYARAICNAALEYAIGTTPQLNPDGTMKTSEIARVESLANTSLENALLANHKGEGPRCSSVRWKSSTKDKFNIPEATLNGVLDIGVRGTIHSVVTKTVLR